MYQGTCPVWVCGLPFFPLTIFVLITFMWGREDLSVNLKTVLS